MFCCDNKRKQECRFIEDVPFALKIDRKMTILSSGLDISFILDGLDRQMP